LLEAENLGMTNEDILHFEEAKDDGTLNGVECFDGTLNEVAGDNGMLSEVEDDDGMLSGVEDYDGSRTASGCVP